MQEIAIAPHSRSVDQPRRCEVVRGLTVRKTASELISGLSEYFPETRDRFVDKVPKFVDSWKFYTWWIVFSTPINFFEFFSSHYSWKFHVGIKKWKCRELDSASIAGTPGRLRGLLVPEIAPWGSKIIAFHARALFAKKMENFRKWGQKNIFTRGKSIFFLSQKKKSGGNRLQHRDARSIKRYRPPRKAHVRLNAEHRFRIFDVPFFWA